MMEKMNKANNSKNFEWTPLSKKDGQSYFQVYNYQSSINYGIIDGKKTII